MKADQAVAPTLDEFLRLAREEYSFVLSFGFQDVEPPRARYQNPFAVHFERDGWQIVVEGLSYGFDAQVGIRSPDGRYASLAHFCPSGFWESHRQSFARGQQGELAYWALGLREFGACFLQGKWAAFTELLGKQEAWIAANRESWERQEKERKMEGAIQRADVAFRAARYAETVTELSAFEGSLPPAQLKKLAIARTRKEANQSPEPTRSVRGST